MEQLFKVYFSNKIGKLKCSTKKRKQNKSFCRWYGRNLKEKYYFYKVTPCPPSSPPVGSACRGVRGDCGVERTLVGRGNLVVKLFSFQPSLFFPFSPCFTPSVFSFSFSVTRARPLISLITVPALPPATIWNSFGYKSANH